MSLRCVLLVAAACCCSGWTDAMTNDEIAKFSNSGCAGGSVSVSVSGSSLVVRTKNIPDHHWQKVRSHSLPFLTSDQSRLFPALTGPVGE